MAKQKRFQAHAAKEATLARRKPRTEARKEANRQANMAAAARNRGLREQGLLTPHEEKKAKRRALRDKLRAEGKLPPIGTPRAAWRPAKSQ